MLKLFKHYLCAQIVFHTAGPALEKVIHPVLIFSFAKAELMLSVQSVGAVIFHLLVSNQWAQALSD